LTGYFNLFFKGHLPLAAICCAAQRRLRWAYWLPAPAHTGRTTAKAF
jgi:hypothetical protein